MHTKPPTLKDRLSIELGTSPPRKKSKITFRSPTNDLEEDEERTCSDEIGGRGKEELDATTTQGNIEEKLKPNLDQVIDNIQVEPVVFVELVVSITKPAAIAIKSF
jgi:hypothetical protein